MPHVHIGVAELATFTAFIIIFGFLWRSLAARWADNSLGQAMAFVY